MHDEWWGYQISMVSVSFYELCLSPRQGLKSERNKPIRIACSIIIIIIIVIIIIIIIGLFVFFFCLMAYQSL